MFFLSLDMKLKKGKLKSILNDSFNEILPDYITSQKFKQGLPTSKENLNSPVIRNIISEIINQKDFHSNCWDSKRVSKDFENNNNVEMVWRIIKYYLLQKGFRDRYSNVDSTNIQFDEVPILNSIN